MTNIGKQVGQAEEAFAANYLVQHGLSIIANNYYCRGGELDLVALHGDELVFVEVRYRQSMRWGDAIESVGQVKQRRWLHAAQCFCAQYPQYDELAMRFDLVAIQSNPGGQDSIGRSNPSVLPAHALPAYRAWMDRLLGRKPGVIAGRPANNDTKKDKTVIWLQNVLQLDDD